MFSRKCSFGVLKRSDKSARKVSWFEKVKFNALTLLLNSFELFLSYLCLIINLEKLLTGQPPLNAFTCYFEHLLHVPGNLLIANLFTIITFPLHVSA